MVAALLRSSVAAGRPGLTLPLASRGRCCDLFSLFPGLGGDLSPRRVRRRDDVPVTADVQVIVRGCDRGGGREQEGRGHGHVPVVVVVVIVLGRSAVRPVAGVRLVGRWTDFRGAASVVHRQRGAMLLLLLVLQVRLAPGVAAAAAASASAPPPRTARAPTPSRRSSSPANNKRNRSPFSFAAGPGKRNRLGPASNGPRWARDGN